MNLNQQLEKLLKTVYVIANFKSTTRKDLPEALLPIEKVILSGGTGNHIAESVGKLGSYLNVRNFTAIYLFLVLL